MGYRLLCFARQVKKSFTEPDITVYKDSLRFPIGCVEVKRPVEDIFKDQNVLGEVYDQLMYLKCSWMLDTPFAILTDYQQWCVCWLDDDESNELAAKNFTLWDLTSNQDSTPSKGQEISPETSLEHHQQRFELGVVSFSKKNCFESFYIYI